jgi:protein-S-isoprenylcysteine O-methyltransferase Ste14
MCIRDRAIFPEFFRFNVPPVVAWTGAGLLCLGSVILVVSIFSLQGALRVGLPKEETRLVTRGIYTWSRNPLYVGVFMVCTASCIFYPNPVNILLAGYSMAVHYQIIRGEEHFLEQRFGDAWRDYTKRVGRWF